MGLAVLLAIGIVAASVWWATPRSTSTAGPAPVPVSSAPTTRPASTGPTTTRPATAGELLEAEVRDSRPVVEATLGYWVPQISSKAIGTEENGLVHDEESIWQNHRQLAAGYPQVALLRSGDYSTFSRSGFWVTIIAQPFSTAAGANAWCDQWQIGADECFAKLISHNAPPEGATVHR